MNEISLPPHLLLPAFFSFLLLVFFFYQRKRFFQAEKWRWIWIGSCLFFVLYGGIVGAAAFIDITAELKLQQFDLNGDGIFSGKEITAEQGAALHKVTADTARDFSFITAIIFSLPVAFLVLLFGKTSDFIKKRKKYTQEFE